jgi:heterodisulfide reductase subunit A
LEQIIYLEPTDDIISIRDRVEMAEAKRVLLVVPPYSNVLARRVDLQVIQRSAAQAAGLNPYLVEMANIREHCSWVCDDTETATRKAESLIAAAVQRVRWQQPLEMRQVDIKQSALVVGGGIAGIQASLDLANAGFQVYFVEKAPSIGGRMAQLDKTFPTLDCSACILTPKMVDAAKHPKIQLLTNSEVTEVNGFVGNYNVTIVKKPRYVDAKKCVGCELCTKVCPVKVPDEFNEGLKLTVDFFRKK